MFYKIFIRDRVLFSLLILCWLLLVSTITFCIDKSESFSWVNSYHNDVLDLFFSTVTFFGDGIFIVILSLIIIFYIKKRALGIALLSTYIISGLLCSLLKHVFKTPRPASFIGEENIQVVSWVSLAYNNSFPSGHTTSIFAAAVTFALFSEKKIFGFLFFILACLVAYSRLYLGQHFFEDLWFGSILGITVSMIYYFVYYIWLNRVNYSFKITPVSFKL